MRPVRSARLANMVPPMIFRRAYWQHVLACIRKKRSPPRSHIHQQVDAAWEHSKQIHAYGLTETAVVIQTKLSPRTTADAGVMPRLRAVPMMVHNSS